MLQANILKLIPKLVYTNGKAGFNDAFDTTLACLLRYSYYLNNKDTKKILKKCGSQKFI